MSTGRDKEMSSGPFGSDNLDRPGHDPERNSRRVLGSLVLVLGVCVLLASFAPEPLRIAAVSNFLIIVSIGVAISALLRREKPFVAGLTRWDQAAILCLLGMLASSIVDVAAVESFLQEHNRG